ncbi:MAG: AbrB/MazE/SpoVT family DNA-binding domain-containing protein [Candidatus Bathyarchaeia archaeon]
MNKLQEGYVRRIQRGGAPNYIALQLTLPKQFCDKLGLELGDYVIVKLDGERIIIEPLKREGGKVMATMPRGQT